VAKVSYESLESLGTVEAIDSLIAETVEFFKAMKDGDIDVKLILKDATGGTVTIKNNTKRPLTVKLPEAYAGVPVAGHRELATA